MFALIFVAILLLHLPLLRLPYFWDEAGYYIPAARDLLLTGSLIPHSTPSNAHPPLVMAYLAACWKVFGFSQLVTRTAMLAVAAFSLLGVYRLGRQVANLADRPRGDGVHRALSGVLRAEHHGASSISRPPA